MLYQTVRPTTFDEVLGNDAIVESLRAIAAQPPEARPHAFMFVGDSGCGKTTIARIFAREIGCDTNSIDFIELNAANTRGIDTIREIVRSVDIAPLMSKCKVYMLDESHQLTAAAQEALLKSIEDTPSWVYFIFCTTNPAELINTLKNRCTTYEVSPLRPPDMTLLITAVSEAYGKNLSDEVVRAIVDIADGCAREALVTLEKILESSPDKALEIISNTKSSEKDVIDLCRLIVDGADGRWVRAFQIFKGLKSSDVEGIKKQIMGYIKECLLGAKDIKQASRYSEMLTIFSDSTYYTGQPGFVNQLFVACQL